MVALQHKKQTIFYGSLVLMECLLWGIGNPLIKIGMRTIPPFYCLGLRFLLAFLLFLLLFYKRIRKNLHKKELLPYCLIGVCTALAFITCNFALLFTSSMNAGFLMGLAVLFTPFLDRILMGTRLRAKHAIPILLVVCGLYLLCGGATGGFGLGEALALFSSFSFAFALAFSGKYLSDQMDPIVISTVQFAIAGGISIVCAFLFESFPGVAAVSPLGWWIIVYLTVGCSCVAYLFQNLALRKVPSTYVALIMCTEPIFTAIAAFFLLKETLSLRGMGGAALILISIVVASLFSEEPKQETI